MISLPGRTSAFSLGSSPSIDSEVTDLPLPDSPTSATVEFCGISKLMPFTASKIVSLSSRKLTRRLRTERMLAVVIGLLDVLVVAPQLRRSRESGNPVSCGQTPLDPRFRGDDAAVTDRR